MRIYTIGFTKKPAAQFFGLLKTAGIEQLIDVRLHNSSQLAGFAKKDDLEFFLKELCGAAYLHSTLLAPEEEMLDKYKKQRGRWEDYAASFTDLLERRKAADNLNRSLFHKKSVLLCSEATAERCHRSLVVKYLQNTWGCDIEEIDL